MRHTAFFLFLFVFGFWSCQQKKQPYNTPIELHSLFDETLHPFYHGVASGDPLPSSVIIWTRVTPEFLEPTAVQWEISADPEFSKLVQTGQDIADSTTDYTVKIDVQELKPGLKYFYRFKALGKYSIVGETRTTPTGSIDSLKLAVVSCSNYEFGFFNSYENLSRREDISAVLHLGDYIYEYGPGSYGDTVKYARKNYPAKEIISLEDYRNRYAQYRLDEDLRLAHQKIAFIPIWDDHEIANNSFISGAQNHQENEGSYEDRKAAAKQAYYEWLPIRETTNHYRSFEFGNLAKVIMLDERLEGRTQPPDSVDDPARIATSHKILGDQQLSWFLNELNGSDQTWKIVGNQVIFSYLNWGFPGFSMNMDSWDGYPIERKMIIDNIKSNDIKNVLFVTGDTHSSFAFEVTDDPFGDYDSITSEGAIAIEYGTTSINSANSNERAPTEDVIKHEAKIVGSPLNPHLKYANLRDHGYLLVTLYGDYNRAQWFYTENLDKETSNEILGKTVVAKKDVIKLSASEN